jgi:hypothetical protein
MRAAAKQKCREKIEVKRFIFCGAFKWQFREPEITDLQIQTDFKSRGGLKAHRQ